MLRLRAFFRSSFTVIPILFHAIVTNIRMLAEEELKRVPIFGRALEDFMDRKNRQAAFESLGTRDTLSAGGRG